MDEVKLAELIRAVIREEISGIKHDLAILKQELAALKAEVDEMKKEMVTKVELMSMEQRFTNSIEKIRDVLKQNKYLAGVLRDTLEERKSLSYWMKNYEERLKIVEVR